MHTIPVALEPYFSVSSNAMHLVVFDTRIADEQKLLLSPLPSGE